MKKINYVIFCLLLYLFVPRVNALNYNIDTQVINTSGSLYEIKVSLKNITDTDYGIAACSMNIELDGAIELNTQVRTLGGWSMTAEEIYLFDTGNPALNSTEFILIPVKATGDGTVNVSNIKCSDGETSVTTDNKTVNIVYKQSSSTGGNVSVVKDSNCDLSNIRLSEGTIDFDPSITEYSIKIDNYEELIVEPTLSSDKAFYSIDTNSEKVVINVVAEDGSKKMYTIYLSDKLGDSSEDNTENNSGEKKSYTPIFIAIICILVLINIFRVVRNMKKG